MSSRNKVARVLVALGSIVLFASAALHYLAYRKVSSPVIGASNLALPLQSVFRVSFLLMAWDWIVIAVVALLAAFAETRLRKTLVLVCGVAILLETALTLSFVGLFFGNQLIGTAGLLIFCGGLFFESPRAG